MNFAITNLFIFLMTLPSISFAQTVKETVLLTDKAGRISQQTIEPYRYPGNYRVDMSAQQLHWEKMKQMGYTINGKFIPVNTAPEGLYPRVLARAGSYQLTPATYFERINGDGTKTKIPVFAKLKDGSFIIDQVDPRNSGWPPVRTQARVGKGKSGELRLRMNEVRHARGTHLGLKYVRKSWPIAAVGLAAALFSMNPTQAEAGPSINTNLALPKGSTATK